VPLLPDPYSGSWLWVNRVVDERAGRSHPSPERLRSSDSGFWLLTSGFYILPGYQGRSPCLVRRTRAIPCGDEARFLISAFVPHLWFHDGMPGYMV
jgi:hypothetical protein